MVLSRTGCGSPCWAASSSIAMQAYSAFAAEVVVRIVGDMQQRVHLAQPELRVAPHDARGSAVVGLVGPNRADPGVVARDGPPQRQDLAVVAALVRPDAVQRPAVLLFILCDGRLGVNVLDRD